MIFRRILLGLLAAATLAAAAAVTIFALAFALYALAEPRLGRAGAAGAVAMATAVSIAVGGVSLAVAARRKPAKRTSSAAGGILERAVSFVRRKPIVAVSAAIGAGLLAARNPKYLGEAVRAFLDGDDTQR